jgi:hypothetical protein
LIPLEAWEQNEHAKSKAMYIAVVTYSNWYDNENAEDILEIRFSYNDTAFEFRSMNNPKLNISSFFVSQGDFEESEGYVKNIVDFYIGPSEQYEYDDRLSCGYCACCGCECF